MANPEIHLEEFDPKYRYQNPVDELLDYLDPHPDTSDLDSLGEQLIREGRAIRVGRAIISLPPTTQEEIAEQRRRYANLAQKYKRDFLEEKRRRLSPCQEAENEF